MKFGFSKAASATNCTFGSESKRLKTMTANDRAWDKIVSETPLVRNINAKGWSTISADTMKAIGNREPRLLAKMDTLASRPQVFQREELVILPATNGNYVVFRDSERLSYKTISE